MVALHTTLKEDLYLVYSGINPDTGNPIIKAHLNPLVLVDMDRCAHHDYRHDRSVDSEYGSRTSGCARAGARGGTGLRQAGTTSGSGELMPRLAAKHWLQLAMIVVASVALLGAGNGCPLQQPGTSADVPMRLLASPAGMQSRGLRVFGDDAQGGCRRYRQRWQRRFHPAAVRG